MKEVKGNIWDYYDQGHWIVITTNGIVKSNGEAVMGRGIALQAKTRLPKLPRMLGRYLKEFTNTPYSFGIEYRIITLPTKNNWRYNSDLELIENSCHRLSEMFKYGGYLDTFVKEIYLPRPGCSNGGLNWKDVKPILEKYLDDRFVVVSKE